ncbi:MAG: FG-GAP-like repeat-containing protein, partial [Armatimonadota bacterium]
TSYYDPLLDYMHLSGDFGGMENLKQALKTQDILFTGEANDWGLRASSLNFLHRAADITGDGRFVFYRDRTGLDLDVFRLGQSWWPTIEARPPTELLDAWTMQPMPEPMWEARDSDLPLEQQFLWGAWRTTLDGTGDLMMIKGHNGGGRLPYHTFSLMEQRMADYTLLKGYRNQILTAADGMVEPQVAMNAALLDHGTLGDTAYAVGEVPKMAFANWRRSIIQRAGRYALFVDDLAFRTDSDNVKVETEWQTVGGHWNAERNAAVIAGSSGRPREDLVDFAALDADIRCGPGTEEELLSDLASIDIVLLKAHEPGVWMEMPFTVEEPVTGRVFADVLNHTDRGVISVALDGEIVVERYDHYAPATVSSQIDLGDRTLEAGEHTLRVEVVGGHEDLDRMFVGLVGVSVQPEGASAEEPLTFELHPSRVMDASGSGTVVLQWIGTAREGQHRRFFSLLAPMRDEEAIGAWQIDESAAVLALPNPALAVSGEYAEVVADAALLAVDHTVALGMTKLPFATASAPVNVRWDYETETMIVEADEPTELAVGERTFTLEPGTHTLEDVRMLDHRWIQRVAELETQARAERERQLAVRAEPEPLEATEMAPVATGEIGGKPVAAEVIPREGGELVALAEGTTVHVLDASGSEARTLTTDGPIRVLRWWAEEDLLLVGCEDEQVIAFDIDSGERRWSFVSEMDQAVWEAGKQYWFKSAYPGIHGLHSGMFGDESLAFVGSACTLEILNAQGELVKRLPIFWGNGWKFQIVPGAEDEPDRLLVARWPNGSDSLAIVSSDGLRETGKGYYGVPEGHTMIGGWTAQNRTGLQYVDVDGDGERELVSATNGVWNRVTVFGEDGAPLHNAQFGPGEGNAPYTNMRDLAVADLDGDGDMEIVVANADGLVVTLDHECNKVWATRLPSPATRLAILTPEGSAPVVLAGCEDGTMARLSADGEITALGAAGGRVETLVTTATSEGPTAIATTADGEVSGWR